MEGLSKRPHPAKKLDRKRICMYTACSKNFNLYRLIEEPELTDSFR